MQRARSSAPQRSPRDPGRADRRGGAGSPVLWRKHVPGPARAHQRPGASGEALTSGRAALVAPPCSGRSGGASRAALARWTVRSIVACPPRSQSVSEAPRAQGAPRARPRAPAHAGAAAHASGFFPNSHFFASSSMGWLGFRSSFPTASPRSTAGLARTASSHRLKFGSSSADHPVPVVRHRPGIARHVGDRVLARQERPVREPLVHHAVDRRYLVGVALDRIGIFSGA